MLNTDAQTLIACPSCDLLFEVGDLQDGETARCSRCDAFLTTYRTNALSRVTAFAASALILLVLACSFPFMSFKASGTESVMTLPGTALALWHDGMPDLALVVAAFIVVVPAGVLVMLLLLASSMKLKRGNGLLKPLGRLIFTLQNWSMVEVFFIGVLVSLVKIAKMATIVIGISFWAYAAFSILFLLSVASLDRFQCWRRIEALAKS